MLKSFDEIQNSDIEKKNQCNNCEMEKIKNSSKKNIVHQDLSLDELAPDGGWGYVIAIAMIIVFVTSYSASPSFAIVFSEFFESTGQSGSAMTILNSIFMVSFSLSGLVTDALLKRYSIRFVGVGAAVLFSVPNVLSAFVTHFYELATICLIQGIGVGLMNTICNANFNAYFVKKRTKVMSATQVIIGLGGIIYPIAIEKMMTTYGFRGTAAMIGVISLNSICGMLMMHPVEWHLRSPHQVLKERQLLEKLKSVEQPSTISKNIDSENSNLLPILHGTHSFLQKSRWSSLGNLKENEEHSSSSLSRPLKVKVDANTDYNNGIRPRSNSARIPFAKRLSIISASSFGNIAVASVEVQYQQIEILTKCLKEKNEHSESKEIIALNENPQANRLEQKKAEYVLLKIMSNSFELFLLKDRAFMIMSLGISFVFVSDFTFSSLLPLAMIHDGYTHSDTALAITIGAAAELGSRIFLAIFTLFVDARAKTMFFFAMIMMGFAKFAYYYFEGTMFGILICISIIGAVRSWIYVPQPLIIVENFSIENYAACYGVFSLVSGITIIAIGPVIGLIKDLTDSFAVSQLLLIVLNCLFIIPWAIELAVDKRKVKMMQEN